MLVFALFTGLAFLLLAVLITAPYCFIASIAVILIFCESKESQKEIANN